MIDRTIKQGRVGEKKYAVYYTTYVRKYIYVYFTHIQTIFQGIEGEYTSVYHSNKNKTYVILDLVLSSLFVF